MPPGSPIITFPTPSVCEFSNPRTRYFRTVPRPSYGSLQESFGGVAELHCLNKQTHKQISNADNLMLLIILHLVIFKKRSK